MEHVVELFEEKRINTEWLGKTTNTLKIAGYNTDGL